MSDHTVPTSARPRVFWIIAGLTAVLVVTAAVFWYYSGRESTDDAQVDAPVIPIGARVSGGVIEVAVKDNQPVKAGDVLVRLDPRDYELAAARLRGAVATAEAEARAADADLPMRSTRTASTLSSAEAIVTRAEGAVAAAERDVDVARARLNAAEAHLRERKAQATRASRDADRLKGLLAKDEISQSQFDSVTATASAATAATDAAESEVLASTMLVRAAEARLAQAKGAAEEAKAGLSSAKTGPQEVDMSKARSEAAQARVAEAKAALEAAELNLARTEVKAPRDGLVTRRSVEVGQLVQVGQPLLAIVDISEPWITANYKETQLEAVRPGQAVTIGIDALGSRRFRGRVDSIAAATGSRFSMLPAENATGNFVKVVQRIPVKIVLEPGENQDLLLRPGMSAVPSIHTRP